MTDSPHPAHSPEFLSRLHDLELPPAEAAAFEEHRRSCESCREAVQAYEQTLSAFRAAPTAPPASDLSARILRKIRAQSPSRRPFGVMFGIDIRWAGAFATALVVVIIATSLPQTKSAERVAVAPTAGPLSAYLVDGVDMSSEGDDRPAPRRERDAEKARENAPASPPANSLPADDKESRLAAAQEAAAPAPPADAGPSAAESPATRETLSAQKTEAKAPAKVLRRQTAYADPAGGEAGASAMNERSLALRLLVTALDSQGAPPPLEAGVADDRLAPLRGREFVLLIESQGRVRSVEVSRAREEGSLNKKDRADADAQEAPDLEALRELRFRPGDRPRRLLVRVE